MKLSEESLTPLYQQVMDDIKSDIESRHYPASGRIPSETELSQMYSVSRITIRRAVEELVQEGYLTKMQGRGTYVNPPKLERKICQESEMQSFTVTCQEAGRTAGAKLLRREVVDARPVEREFLGLPEGAKLIYIQRLRTADNIPIMLENNFFPYNGFQFLLDTNLENNSIFEISERGSGRKPEDDRLCTLEIVLANLETAAPLGVDIGAPLFFEHIEFLDGEKRPFFIGKQYIVGSLYVFNI